MSFVANLALAFSVAASVRLGIVFVRHPEFRVQAANLSVPLTFSDPGESTVLIIPLIFGLAAVLLGAATFFKKSGRRGLVLGGMVWLAVLLCFGTDPFTISF